MSQLGQKDLKTTEEIKRDVQAQLQMLKAAGGSPKHMLAELTQSEMAEDLRNSMGDQNLQEILHVENRNQTLTPRGGGLRKRKSSRPTVMTNKHGPIYLLGINRDPLSVSHRQIASRVKNTRDVVKLGNVHDAKFEQYTSPA